MPSLIDRDQTRAREEAYPDTAGALLKGVGLSMAEVDAAFTERYIDWVQELLKRDDVHFAVKMAIIGGADPMNFGGTIPAIMMSKLEPAGLTEGVIEGDMTVSEKNKATEASKDAIKSVTNAGIGTPFWNVNEQLTASHTHDSNQTRSDDYRARAHYKMTLGRLGEPEGVGVIKEFAGKVVEEMMKINLELAQAEAEVMKKQAVKEAPSADQVAEFMNKTDPKDPTEDGGDDSGSSDDEAGTPTEESGE